jgi:hypothetical protein
MAKALTEKEEEKLLPKAAVEAEDEVVEIDPADFVDPEEFGYRRVSRL